jgi:orotate phosphoribosyltransferase
LRFCEFTLKSGRRSPYFFNAGMFNSGVALPSSPAAMPMRLRCTAWASTAVRARLQGHPARYRVACDMRAAAATCRWPSTARKPRPWRRRHLIGAPLAGRVLIVDDVITAGTAIREALAIIRDAGGIAAGIVIALDRQEAVGPRRLATLRGTNCRGRTRLPVVSVASLTDLLEFAGGNADLLAQRERLLAYRAAYGSETTR